LSRLSRVNECRRADHTGAIESAREDGAWRHLRAGRTAINDTGPRARDPLHTVIFLRSAIQLGHAV